MSISKWLADSIGIDKVAHYAISGWLLQILLVIGDTIPAILIVLGAGIAKEGIDWLQGGKFDKDDLTWDFLGCLTATIIYIFM